MQINLEFSRGETDNEIKRERESQKDRRHLAAHNIPAGTRFPLLKSINGRTLANNNNNDGGPGRWRRNNSVQLRERARLAGAQEDF